MLVYQRVIIELRTVWTRQDLGDEVQDPTASTGSLGGSPKTKRRMTILDYLGGFQYIYI